MTPAGSARMNVSTRFDRLRTGAATLSIVYNVLATAVKLVAAYATGSVSLFSEAAHSATDIFSSVLAFFSIRAAAQPPDQEHPYGHGKIESLTGLAESILLLLIVIYIVKEGVVRLWMPAEVQHLDLGIWVMALSSISSLGVAIYVQKIGRRTNSMALQANGQHLLLDFWTSLGVLIALGISKVTGWDRADSVLAIAFGLWLGWGALKMCQEAVDQLIDKRITDDELAVIQQILTSEPGVISYHRLRTRHSGALHYVDVHVVVPREWSVVQAHDIADRLEKSIAVNLAPAEVVIHVDPEGEPED